MSSFFGIRTFLLHYHPHEIIYNIYTFKEIFFTSLLKSCQLFRLKCLFFFPVIITSLAVTLCTYVVSATHPAVLTPAQARAAHGRGTLARLTFLGPGWLGAQTGLQRFERPARVRYWALATGATWTPAPVDTRHSDEMMDSGPLGL